MKQRIGLVLTGGGARAAYQAGVLRAIAEMSSRRDLPFRILTGVSAGGINAAYLACHADNFQEATTKLWQMWEGLRSDNIFRVNRTVIPVISTRWIADVVLRRPSSVNGPKPQYLLDTKPLLELLKSNLDFDAIKMHIKSGGLHGVAFSATNYDTGTAMTFFDGVASARPWLRRTRLGIRTHLTAEHVVASTAMPVFFPPVLIRGSYYGDGCIRMTAPLSPALHLGADRILAVGIHCPRNPDIALAIAKGKIMPYPSIKPSIADVFGVLLSAVFLEALEFDLERLQRINDTVRFTSMGPKRYPTQKLRQISVMTLQPERDLGSIACDVRSPLPFRHLLYALGSVTDKSTEILSFLAFDKKYTSILLNLGFRDAMARKDELKKFLAVA